MSLDVPLDRSILPLPMVFIGMKILNNGIGEAPEYTLGIGTSIVLLLAVMGLLDRMDLIDSGENSEENSHEDDLTQTTD